MSAEKWHGTVGGYTNHKCRCTECRSAATVNMRKWKAEQRRTGHPPERVHGTDNGYTNYCCRCERCTAAHAAWSRDYDARRRRSA